jgi:predicted anti-sigma-YlaC factor YlaD
MSTVRPSVICDRVRSQISLELDNELSQLERAMVAAHVERCADCRAYQHEVASFTSALRAAPLEPMESPIALRAPRRTIVARLQAGAAAAVALVALGVATQIATESRSPSSSPLGTLEIRYPTQRAIAREQAMLRSVNARQRVRLVLDGYVL